MSSYSHETIQLTPTQLVLSGCPTATPATNSIIVMINPTNNLAVSEAQPPPNSSSIPPGLHSLVREVSDANLNLSNAEREWLCWHQHLGHVNFNTVQFLMRSGILAKSQRSKALHSQISKLVSAPKCAACQYAKAHRRSIPSQRSHSRVTPSSNSLSKNKLFPGQEVLWIILSVRLWGACILGMGQPRT